ncbi:MAG: hypothetical protein AW11_02116 [Candidatus Accumulibacter regalis]|uniref:TSP C-terminal domain-containing protein n=1 Tax=Accumulibacter regalis TaxID=522306 RepID=A0A011PM23_ACCRE|nr:PEP-CTERM sorting domain-containing protein [Accumulibacter sp.]EXI88496.1 MAG: hypothetical protein AW11_02116 [Candidatus Accumulibacter regalis]HRE71003.1 PEP-CTERM sorting domain-containing protein [Accumulibacter sp.]
MKTQLIALAVASAISLAPDVASAAPVDLSTWTAESYPAVSGFGAGVWTVASGGGSVTQSVNGQPTFFYSDFNAIGTKITGKIKPGSGDDDYVGFALGFRPGDSTNSTANYLLIDWKQGTQGFDFGTPSSSPGGTANGGLAVSLVTGIPDADEFWQHANLAGTSAANGLTELARGTTRGNVGWVVNTEYEFTFDFGPNDLEVFVNGVKEIDITGSFADGRIAFYNFSQANVVYSAFTKEVGTFPPGGGSVPEPTTIVLIGLGLAGLGFRSRKNAGS